MTQTRGRAALKRRHEALGLSDDDVLEMYRMVVLARPRDERAWRLNRQGKAPIVGPAQGHEAAQVGSAWAMMRSGPYFVFPYYRCTPAKLAYGVTVREMLLSMLAKQGDPFSGARQFGGQGAYLDRKLIQNSNVVAAGLLHAVGYAYACRYLKDPTVVITHFGDGASSEGETHEAMNFAAIYKLPVIFFCENNRYAISVPQRKQMAIENVADRAQGYGFPGVVVNGVDILAVYEAVSKAAERARQGEGPTLIEAKLERLMDHTSDDQQARYRSKEEIEQARRDADPIPHFRSYLTEAGVLTEERDRQVQEWARREVDEATDFALAAPYPEATEETFYRHLYAE